MKLFALGAAAALFVSGCMTYDPYSGEKKTSNATKGAIGGAVAGAAVGALTQTSDGKEAFKNAVIGAAAGAAVGGGVGVYMDRQEAKLRQQLEGSGVRVVRNGDNIQLVMPSDITFASAQASVTSSFDNTLQSVALVLNEFDKTQIAIAGHADAQGADDYNLSLSQQRAQSVASALASRGVDPTRIQAVGYGETAPIADNSTPSGRALNRRVEVQIIPQGV
ncbi:MAG: OmpA family protein [Pseudomonadota bacterium]